MKLNTLIKGIFLPAFALCLFMGAGKAEVHAATQYGLSSLEKQTLQPGDTITINQDGMTTGQINFTNGVDSVDLTIDLSDQTYELLSFEEMTAQYSSNLSYPTGYAPELNSGKVFAGWYVSEDLFFGQGGDRFRFSIRFDAVWADAKENKTENRSAHTNHNYEWNTILEPTAESDGQLAYQCTECGTISQTTGLSGMGTFVKQSINQVTKAEKSANVTLNTKVWYSFPKSVYEAIQARPDITVTINFTYKNTKYTVTIPAGADVLSLVDENGYCGFLKLIEVFGGQEIK